MQCYISYKLTPFKSTPHRLQTRQSITINIKSDVRILKDKKKIKLWSAFISWRSSTELRMVDTKSFVSRCQEN